MPRIRLPGYPSKEQARAGPDHGSQRGGGEERPDRNPHEDQQFATVDPALRAVDHLVVERRVHAEQRAVEEGEQEHTDDRDTGAYKRCASHWDLRGHGLADANTFLLASLAPWDQDSSRSASFRESLRRRRAGPR